jgi:hypothetical protein
MCHGSVPDYGVEIGWNQMIERDLATNRIKTTRSRDSHSWFCQLSIRNMTWTVFIILVIFVISWIVVRDALASPQIPYLDRKDPLQDVHEIMLVSEIASQPDYADEADCTLFVATTGSDTNLGGTKEEPFRTIQMAADVAKPGDVVCVAPGLYQERVEAKTSGTAEQPIVFHGLEGAVLDGGDPITDWDPAPEVGDGVYKTNALPYNPGVGTANDKAVAEIDSSLMGGSSGFEILRKPPEDPWWDGIEVVFGYLDGVTFVRFRHKEHPNNLNLKFAPSWNGVFRLYQKSHIIIEGFTIKNGWSAVYIRGERASHNIVQNNLLLHGTGTVIVLEDAHNNIIRNNEITLRFFGASLGDWGHSPEELHTTRKHIYETYKREASPGKYGVWMYYAGSHNEVYENHIYQHFVGVGTYAGSTDLQTRHEQAKFNQHLNIHHNLIHNMNSVGIALGGPSGYAQAHDNIVYDCNLNLRFQDPSTGPIYVYRNRFSLTDNEYTPQIYWYWNDPEAYNFPLDQWEHVEYYLYHNSWSGGREVFVPSSWGDDVGLPQVWFLNNILSGKEFFRGGSVWDQDDMFGGLDYNWVGGELRYPEWLGENNIFAEGESMWVPGDHELLLLAESPARGTGLDLSQPFSLDGEIHDPLPGMNPGYFSGSNPDLGAVQFNESTTTFRDVPIDHWAYDYIETLYQQGYIVGCSLNPHLYCPEGILNRAEEAVVVVRGVHGADFIPPDPTEQIFGDAFLNDWFIEWVNQLWNDGYTAGCSTEESLYCPYQENTIAEGCVFFLRVNEGVDYVPPDAKGIFPDVPLDTWYAPWVEACHEKGILLPCQTEPELHACPLGGLDRATAAYMMVQAKGLQMP